MEGAAPKAPISSRRFRLAHFAALVTILLHLPLQCHRMYTPACAFPFEPLRKNKSESAAAFYRHVASSTCFQGLQLYQQLWAQVCKNVLGVQDIHRAFGWDSAMRDGRSQAEKGGTNEAIEL